jgi:hypothetical protein
MGSGRSQRHLLEIQGQDSTGWRGVSLAAPPEGFAYLIDADGAYLVDSDGAYLIGAI